MLSHLAQEASGEQIASMNSSLRSSSFSRRKQLLSSALLSATLLLLLVACGREASQKDCDRIVERLTELEMEKLNLKSDENAGEFVIKVKERMKESVMSQCIGRRMRDESMRCIENATTAEAVNQCF